MRLNKVKMQNSNTEGILRGYSKQLLKYESEGLMVGDEEVKFSDILCPRLLANGLTKTNLPKTYN